MAMAAQPEMLERLSGAVTPLTLETIDPAVLPAVHALLQRHGPCVLRIQQQDIRFAWANVQLRENAISIAVACGGHELLIELENLGAIDPLLIGEPFELLPLALRSLVVQRAIASLLANAPRALAESIQVTDMRWRASASTRDWPIKLGFRLQRGENGGVSQGQLLARSAAALVWLEEQLPTQPARSRTNLQALPIPIRLMLGRTELTKSTLSNLAIGDVVWVQSARLTRAGVEIDCHIGNLSVALATVRHRQLHFKHTLQHNRELAMKQQPGADAPAAPRPIAVESDRTLPSRNLEVPVTFDLGELTLPLAQLERLQAGALLELPQDVSDSTIQLRVGNSLVARGALVAIGKRLGVRITRVYLEEREQPAAST
jgi:type III secretion protein Q